MDNQPSQQPVTPDPSQAPITQQPTAYGGLPTPQPDAPYVPMTPTKKRSRKWLLMLGLPILLLGGGSAAAYYSYYQPRQTNKKVLEAIYRMAEETPFTSVKATLEATQDGSSSPMVALDMTAGSDADGNTRADMEVTYSALRLSGSMIARTDQSVFVKINELPTLLSLADSYTGAGLSSLGETIGDKWIKLDLSSLADTGLVDESQTSEATACTTALQNLFGSGRQAFMDQIAKVYDQNSFLSAKKVGGEAVEGQDTTKYSLTINKDKLSQFLTSDQLSLPELETACGMTGGTSDQDKQELQKSLNGVTVSDTYIWLSKSGTIAKMATKLGAEGTTVSMDMTFGSASLNADEPTDVITTDELMQQVQGLILNSYLNSSSEDVQIPEEYLQGLEAL